MINDQTTLAQLNIERAKYGITELNVEFFGTVYKATLYLHINGMPCKTFGHGDTIGPAIEEAFVELRKLLGEELSS